jgi:hypothetical protein
VKHLSSGPASGPLQSHLFDYEVEPWFARSWILATTVDARLDPATCAATRADRQPTPTGDFELARLPLRSTTVPFRGGYRAGINGKSNVATQGLSHQPRKGVENGMWRRP